MTMNSYTRWNWSSTTSGRLREALCLIACMACGGHSEPAVRAEQADGCREGVGESSAQECLEVAFPPLDQSSASASTGLAACSAQGYPPDVFSTRGEACAGRGLGKSVNQNV